MHHYYILDGFGAEAEKYIDWLKQHEADLRILQYGFRIRKQEFSEHIVSDNARDVAERVVNEVKEKDDKFSAVVLGVDKPWEVCLVKLMSEVIRRSAPMNFRELDNRNMFGQTSGLPNHIRSEIEEAFLAARNNRAAIGKLAGKLEEYGLFEKYQDRFFALVRSVQ